MAETAKPIVDGDQMKAFAKDQVEAVRIARDGIEAPNHQLRLDACYLAQSYLQNLPLGASYSVESVIATARKFAAYLSEP